MKIKQQTPEQPMDQKKFFLRKIKYLETNENGNTAYLN